MDLPTQRKITSAFIDFLPVTVVLTPRERTKQPGGGVRLVEQAPRAPQTMTLVEPTITQGTRPAVTLDGIERTVDFVLLGEWDATIGLYDVFDYGGSRWEVVDLIYFNGWERRALVAKHG